MHELRQDESEASDFDHLMEEYGEEPGALERDSEHHHHGAPLDHHGHGPEHHHERHDAEGREREEGEAENEIHDDDDERRAAEERVDDDEDHLAGALEAFYTRLQSNETVVLLDNATMAKWQSQYDSATRALSDEDEEADMEHINSNIAQLLNETHPQPPQFNATRHASMLDHFTELMYRAKLQPYREELTTLIRAWMDGDKPFSEALHRVEELIDDNVLQPDVLMVPDQYGEHYGGHYPYDD